jgi:hypothetical protein
VDRVPPIPPDATPTQRRILAVLADGLGHRKAELWACLGDEKATKFVLATHLCNLRKKLRPRGYDIVAVRTNEGPHPHYRWVRLLYDCSKD